MENTLLCHYEEQLCIAIYGNNFLYYENYVLHFL